MKKKNKEERKAADIYFNIITFLLLLVRAFFSSIFQLAWGLVSIFALNGILAWLIYNKSTAITTADIQTLQIFINIEQWIIYNWIIVLLVIFAVETYAILKEMKLL